MSGATNYDDDRLEVAKNLVSALESEDAISVSELIEKLRTNNESVIFQEIGKLTRDLHDALQGFEMDVDFNEIVSSGLPDAKQRLNFVIEKTQEAADNTLTIVEEHIPICERLEIESRILSSDWNKFMSKEMNADDFRVLSKRMTIYIDDNKKAYKGIMSGMNDIIMAQGFQDITGQIIKKVITLVQEVEDNLVRVIKITESSVTKSKRNSDDLEGPQIPGINASSEVVSGQDEVDDLLSSLGF